MKAIKFLHCSLPVSLALLLPGLAQIHAQTTAFTYQGRLTDAGQPASGHYDLLFQVFDAATGGASIGGTVATNGVPVTNGLFTVALDFGGTPFTGAARWLQIQVSPNGAGTFTALSPRQPLTPAPRAVYANSAGTVTNGAIGSSQLAASAITSAILQNNAVTASKIASGQVVKSLNGLTDAVSLTQGANVTINTVGNSLQISAPAGGLSLPYNGSVSTSGSAFTVSNSQNAAYGILGSPGSGVYGNASGVEHSAVRAEGLGNAWGVFGSSEERDGVYGTSLANGGYAGVRGNGTGSSIGVVGIHASTGNNGLLGHFGYGADGVAVVPSGVGTRGYHVPTGNYGLLGHSVYGVDGVATANESFGTRGIHVPTGNYGVLGATNAGVVAVSGSGTAIYGQSGGGSTAPQMRLLQTSLSDSCRLRLGIQDGEYWDIVAERLTAGTIAAELKFKWLGSSPTITMHRTGRISAQGFDSTSDRNAKENFSEVRPREVLEKVVALPIRRWNFKQDSSTEHIGPMAQDFYAAFGVGIDDKHIATVDADGVALAAIQGLNEIVREKQSEIESLKSRLDRLEKLLEARQPVAEGGVR